jgi:predicted lipoprotein with Yx(FWY)xxD motif
MGTVLVNSSGDALYMFVPDGRRQVTCTSMCAATWPPLRVSTSATLSAGPGVKSALLGSDPDPAGGSRVVTYNGWPLYTYTADVQPGQYTGQGIDLNGGDWYLMRPSGKPLETQPQ